MENTSKLSPVSDRDIFYYRQRSKNRLFEALTAFFAEEAERRGISKRDVAECLRRDPASITRWLTAPSNLTLDTISDLLLSLGAEMDYAVAKFEDRPRPNEMHPLIAQITAAPALEYKQPQKPKKQFQPLTPAGSSEVIGELRAQ
jgi:hypothetical protein